jgi:hypothetical protein
MYSRTRSKSCCCRIGKSVQGFKRVGHGLFFGLVMEPCVLRFLFVWTRSGFERSVWQVRMYSSNVVRLVLFCSIRARCRSSSALSSASFRFRCSSSARCLSSSALSSASFRFRCSSSARCRSSSALSSASFRFRCSSSARLRSNSYERRRLHSWPETATIARVNEA